MRLSGSSRALVVPTVAALLLAGLPGPSAQAETPSTSPTIVSPKAGSTVTRSVKVEATSAAERVRFRLAEPAAGISKLVTVVDGVATARLPTWGLGLEETLLAADCSADGACNWSGAARISIDVYNAIPILTSPESGTAAFFWESVTVSGTSGGGGLHYQVVGSGDWQEAPGPGPVTFDLRSFGAGWASALAHLCTANLAVCRGGANSVPFYVKGVEPRLRLVDDASFSPNGDGQEDQLPLRLGLRSAATVKFVVRDGDGSTVSKGSHGLLGAGSHTLMATGLADGGAPLPDGRYVYEVIARAEADPSRAERASVGVVIDTRFPTVELLGSGPRPFYPLRDGYRDEYRMTIRFTGLPGIVSHHITNSDGQVVRSWTRTRSDRSGRQTLTWNGKDDLGRRVPAGGYRVRVNVADWAGNVVTMSAPIRVSDKKLVKEEVTVQQKAAGTWKRQVGGCSAIRASDRWRGGLDYLSDIRCSSRPYRSNRKHIVVGYYRATLPPAVRYGNVRLSAYGGARRGDSALGVAVYDASRGDYTLRRWSGPRLGWHALGRWDVANVNYGYRIYWLAFVNEAAQYQVRKFRLSIDRWVLRSP